MKKTYVYFIALSAALAGCTRATFSPIGDAGQGGPEVGTADAGSCQHYDAACAAATKLLGMCDPVCQTGPCKWCQGEKCSIAGDNSTTICTQGGPRTLMQSCQVFNANSNNRSDTCGPGYICLGNGGGVEQCFSLCGSSADCTENVACTPRPVAPPSVSQAYVCDPPYDSCDSLCCNPISNTGCLPEQTCYLVTNLPSVPNSHTNRTVCEYVSGSTPPGSPCDNSRDCYPTNVCSFDGKCHPVCNATNTCVSGAQCLAYGDQYGYCQF
jgi:hypothetical protein